MKKTIEDFDLIENNSKVYINGSVWETNSFGDLKITGKVNKKTKHKCYPFFLCEFKDGTLVVAKYGHIKKGEVKNPYKPKIYGVGYMGEGEYKCSIKYKKTKEYVIWENMMKRCYDVITQNKNPTYKGTYVCKRWHNFQNFCEDIKKLDGYSEWKNNTKKNKWHLDKDVKNGYNKFYSKENCMFITLKQNNQEMIYRTKNYP